MHLGDHLEALHCHELFEVDTKGARQLTTLPISSMVVNANYSHYDLKSYPQRILGGSYRLKAWHNAEGMLVGCK